MFILCWIWDDWFVYVRVDSYSVGRDTWIDGWTDGRMEKSTLKEMMGGL